MLPNCPLGRSSCAKESAVANQACFRACPWPRCLTALKPPFLRSAGRAGTISGMQLQARGSLPGAFSLHSSIFVSMRHPRTRNSSLLVMCKIISQCRCIPFRFVDDARSPSSVQVLLITSSGGNGWVFPKGGWELDETAESAALRETVEEGGVRGDLDPAVLGAYPYSNRKTSPTRKGCIAHMYAMSVREELSVWPESHSRERCWVCTFTTCYSWILHAYTWSPELTIHLAWHKTN